MKNDESILQLLTISESLTTEQISKRMDMKVDTVRKRMRIMDRKGLLSKVKVGKEFRWSLKAADVKKFIVCKPWNSSGLGSALGGNHERA